MLIVYMHAPAHETKTRLLSQRLLDLDPIPSEMRCTTCEECEAVLNGVACMTWLWKGNGHLQQGTNNNTLEPAHAKGLSIFVIFCS